MKLVIQIEADDITKLNMTAEDVKICLITETHVNPDIPIIVTEIDR